MCDGYIHVHNVVCAAAEAPSVTPSPATVTVTEGDTAVFSCVVTGDPTPVLSWYHMGTLLPGETGGSLTLEGVGREEEGPYECVASNQVGDDRAIITLIVYSEHLSIQCHHNVLILFDATTMILQIRTQISNVVLRSQLLFTVPLSSLLSLNFLFPSSSVLPSSSICYPLIILCYSLFLAPLFSPVYINISSSNNKLSLSLSSPSPPNSCSISITTGAPD